MPSTTPSRPRSPDLLISLAQRTQDPRRALARIAEARAAITGTHGRLQATTTEIIRTARAHQLGWAEIGQILGVSTQRAEQLGRKGTS